MLVTIFPGVALLILPRSPLRTRQNRVNVVSPLDVQFRILREITDGGDIEAVHEILLLTVVFAALDGAAAWDAVCRIEPGVENPFKSGLNSEKVRGESLTENYA